LRRCSAFKGPETWKWTERNPWAGNLLDAVRTSFNLKPGHFQDTVGQPVIAENLIRAENTACYTN